MRAVLLTSANALEVIVCLGLLRRAASERFDITRGRHLISFIVVAGVVAPASSSVVAALALSSEAPFLDTCALWFAADALGLLIFTPALLAIGAEPRGWWSTKRRIEALLSLACLSVVSAFVFGQSTLPLLFLISPALTLATFRLGISGAAAGLLVVTGNAIAFAVLGHGPTQLIDGSEIERVFMLQAFLAVMSISTLPIAAALANTQRLTDVLKKAREEAIREGARAVASETQYRTLADYSSDIVVRFGPGGIIRYASPACALLGVTPEEAIGRSTIEFAAPEDRAFAASVVAHLFSGEEPDRSLRREYRFRRPDGSLGWLEGDPNIVRDPSGRPVEVVSIYRDVTARRTLEDELERARDTARLAAEEAAASEHRYRTMAEISLDMIARTGLDGRIHFVSPSCTSVMGYTPDEMVGTTTLSHMHPDDVASVVAFLRTLIDEGPTARARAYAFRARRKDGSFIWLEGIPRIIFDASGHPIEIQDSARDVTARKEMEQALAEAKRAAEVAAQAKADFLANMSHEIRPPLNTVLGYSRLLDQSDTISGDDRRYVDFVLRSGKALLAIVNDVLDLSALDAGALRVDRRPIVLRAIGQQVADEFARAAYDKGLQLSLSWNGAPDEHVMGDEGRIRQVLTNLVGNAIKFTQSGTIDIDVDAGPIINGQRRVR